MPYITAPNYLNSNWKNVIEGRFQTLLKASFENEGLLWLTEEEYAEILLGMKVN